MGENHWWKGENSGLGQRWRGEQKVGESEALTVLGHACKLEHGENNVNWEIPLDREIHMLLKLWALIQAIYFGQALFQ